MHTVTFISLIFYGESEQSLRVQKWIAGISIILFMIKIFAWYLTRSVAFLTDGLESIVNVVAGLIGVYSLYVSAKPLDPHPITNIQTIPDYGN